MSTRGRRTARTLRLTREDWLALQATQQLDLTTPETPLGRHARIVLLRAKGLPITAIARQVGLSRTHTYKWLRRWEAAGLAGLQARKGGRPRGWTRLR